MFDALTHTWDSIKEHFEKLLSHSESRLEDLRDELHSDLISMRADLRSALSRVESLEQAVRLQIAERISPRPYSGDLEAPERPQRIEPQPMIALAPGERPTEGRPAALETLSTLENTGLLKMGI